MHCLLSCVQGAADADAKAAEEKEEADEVVGSAAALNLLTCCIALPLTIHHTGRCGC
jgi:hypothetical protein